MPEEAPLLLRGGRFPGTVPWDDDRVKHSYALPAEAPKRVAPARSAPEAKQRADHEQDRAKEAAAKAAAR